MSDTPGAVFARRLRQERKRARITQAQLASGLAAQGFALDGSAITRIERLERAVKLEEAVAIARILGLPLESLLVDPTDPSGDRIAELQHELVDAEWQVSEARAQLERAQASVEAIKSAIAQLRR